MGYEINEKGMTIKVHFHDMRDDAVRKERLLELRTNEHFIRFLRTFIVRRDFLKNADPVASTRASIISCFKSDDAARVALTDAEKDIIREIISEKCPPLVAGIKLEQKTAFLSLFPKSNKSGSITRGSSSVSTGLIHAKLSSQYAAPVPPASVPLGHEGGATDRKEFVFEIDNVFYIFAYCKHEKGSSNKYKIVDLPGHAASVHWNTGGAKLVLDKGNTITLSDGRMIYKDGATDYEL